MHVAISSTVRGRYEFFFYLTYKIQAKIYIRDKQNVYLYQMNGKNWIDYAKKNTVNIFD